MSKTLGQVAFEAYYKGGGWEAAAEAVRATVVSEAAVNEQIFYSPMSPIRDEERAVIEAAKAMAFTRCSTITEANKAVLFSELCDAIEALKEVESE